MRDSRPGGVNEIMQPQTGMPTQGHRAAASDASARGTSVPASQDDAERQLILNQKRIRGAAASARELLLVGRRAFLRGDDALALESLNRLTHQENHFADVHYMVGMIHERQGNLQDAFDCLRRAVRINPSYVEALLALASLQERRGEYEISQSYAERASQLSRPAADGLDSTTRGKLANQQAELAEALEAAGERREAIEQYRAALDRCPNFHDIRHRLAIALREAGLPHQASEEFQRILEVHPGLLESQIQLGLTYYTLGRTPDAIAEWEAVLERDPGRDEARMYLRLVRGSAAREANRRALEEVASDEAISSRSVGSAGDGWQTRTLESQESSVARAPATPGSEKTLPTARKTIERESSWETLAEEVFSGQPRLEDLDFDDPDGP